MLLKGRARKALPPSMIAIAAYCSPRAPASIAPAAGDAAGAAVDGAAGAGATGIGARLSRGVRLAAAARAVATTNEIAPFTG